MLSHYFEGGRGAKVLSDLMHLSIVLEPAGTFFSTSVTCSSICWTEIITCSKKWKGTSISAIHAHYITSLFATTFQRHQKNVNSNAFLVIFKAKLGNFKIIIKLVSQKLDFL